MCIPINMLMTLGAPRRQRRIFIFGSLGYYKFWKAEVAVVTFSDSESAPLPKLLNPDQKKFQISESDSCSDWL